MDRRQMTPGPHLMRPNSFIPTSSSSNNPGPNNGKMGQFQIQQLALQSQLQAQSVNNNHQQYHQQFSSYYQNTSDPNNQFSQHGMSMSRHSSVPEPSLQMPPPPNSRTLRKSVSTHYGPQVSVVNGNSPLYGNLMGGGNGRPPMSTMSTGHSQQPTVINQIQQSHHSHKILQHYPGEGDGLPSTLVESMRTLFDILDDSKSGRVRLSDIESRWENNEGIPKGNTGAEPLIKMGVMGYLRKVTPPDGMLTFDRFCSGLRLALVTNNNNNSSGGSSSLHNNGPYGNNNHIPQQSTHSNSAKNGSGHLYANNNPSAINGTSGQSQSQRPTSLPIPTSHNVNQSGQRTMTGSRIPGFSVSKLPMANNVSVSPKNKFGSPPSHAGTARRIPLSQSAGTTVAMVHQPPKQSTGHAISAFSHRPHDIQIGTIRLTKPTLVTPPNGGFTKTTRYSSNNGSLDNLKSEGEGTNGKVRPPSAPLLDTTDEDDGGEYYSAGKNRSGGKRERARSRDRDIDDTKRGGGKSGQELSFGKRVVSFVTPRQRTLRPIFLIPRSR